MMKSQFLLTVPILIISLSIDAEIISDGSLGSHANLPGPDYLIEADLGRQLDGNLFHSFKDFNLNSHESATFSGPNSVSNVISRVTGGNPSNIDGLIRSTIPNADMYFLNPYGIMFGPNARLDVQGSFHASTADYLRLQNSGRFDARNPSDSILTVAPVEAFGFLDNQIAGISIEGIGEMTKVDGEGKMTGLVVPNRKTLSMIGGDIEITGSYYYNDEYIREYRGYIRPLGNLTAASGRINLASVASEGVVIPTLSSLDISTFNKLGKITLSQKSLLEVSGPIAGSLFIRANQLVVSDASRIFSNILDYREGNALFSNENNHYANIDIKLQTLSVTDQSWIAGYSFIAGNLGDISIQADDIFLNNGSWINSQSYTSGDTGNISIKTHHISIEEGGIAVIARNTGNAGHIHIQATDTISVIGADREAGWSSGILSIATPNDKGIIGGIGGDILLETGELILKNGAKISSSTIAGEEKQSSRSGNITISATGMVQLSGVNPYGENENGLGSGIYVRSKGANAGDAGTISLTANALSITEGAEISGSTSGRGQGGHINLNINGPISISGDSADVILKEPKDSQLKFQQDFPDYQKDRIAISGIYGNSFSNANDAGESGTIKIKTTNNINLTEGALINTSTQQAGGGHITITTPNLLYLQEGGITTSVHAGKGSGGDISIENPTFVVLNQGKIKAQADEGHGGDIYIKSEQFIASNNSLISASSRLGLDGLVYIDSPDVNVAGFLVVLPGGFVEAQLKQCTSEEIENPSNFKVDLTRKRTLPFEKFIELK
jgi:filamentous hemagglutinin family protein